MRPDMFNKHERARKENPVGASCVANAGQERNISAVREESNGLCAAKIANSSVARDKRSIGYCVMIRPSVFIGNHFQWIHRFDD